MERPEGIPEEHRATWDALVAHARANGCVSYDELNEWLPADVESQDAIDGWLAALDLPGWLEALPQAAPHQQAAMVRFSTTARPGDLFADGRVDAACNTVWQYVREHVVVVEAELAQLALTLVARYRDLGLDATALGEVAEHALGRAAAVYDPGRRYPFAALAAWMIDRALWRAVELRASRDGTHDAIVPRLRALPTVPLPRPA